MKSIYAVTEEYDVELAAKEMIAEITAQLPLQKNAVGILYYDYEMEGAALCSCLQEAFAIDILGCSTIATVNNQSGYRDMAAALTVLTADDCEFHVGVTPVLTDETVVDKIHQTFAAAKKESVLPVELVFTLLPCASGIIFDRYIDDLSRMTDAVPIIGGVPAEQGSIEKSMFLNGKYCSGKAVVLLISGNLKPIISLANIVETLSDRNETITKADGTTIYEVEGRSFADYIESYGMNIREFNKDESRIFFQKYPLLIDTDDGRQEKGVPYVRIIGEINWEDGSGIAYAGIQEGAKTALGIFHKKTIVETVEKGLKDLFEQIEKSEEEYSVILCITCAARHFILNPEYGKEGELIRKMVSDTYQLSGFYSYGELCPVYMKDGKARNQLHNGSIVFCAI